MNSVKRRLLKWLCGALAVVACLLVVADLMSARYLRRKSQRYKQEVEEIQRQDAAYRRPVTFGEPVNQNAALWYRLALPHLSMSPEDDKALRTAVEAGIAGYPTSSAAHDRCGETHSVRVRNALRSTRCDWDLGFGADELNAFDRAHEAHALAECLVLEGHGAASRSDNSAAVQSYLEAVAVGCDLARGNDLMCLVGMVDSLDGLFAIGKFALTVHDVSVLDEIARRLLPFATHLPDGRATVRRYRLWLENASALDELANNGERFRGLARIVPFRTLGAWQLWRATPILREFDAFSSISNRDDGLKLLELLRRDSSGWRSNWIVRADDFASNARVPLNAFDELEVYHATQLSLQLQRWRIEHGRYPPTIPQGVAPAETSGLKYEPTVDGRGFKLSGNRGTLLEARH